MTAVKICGLTSAEAVAASLESGADYLGFVFFPASPRSISPAQAAELAAPARGKAKVVAVCVDPDDALLHGITATLKPDFIQLHGDESPQRVQAIKERTHCPVIKAIKVKSSDDIASAQRYIGVADALLFDACAPEAGMLPGGNGLAFDWVLLKGRAFDCPWFLSGGLNAENVREALRQSGATMVDASSSLESAPGVKDVVLIKAFVAAAKEHA